MKLFTKYNRINLVATVIVFLFSGISFYFLLRYVLISQVDEDLQIEQHEIQTYAAKYQKLPEIIAVRDQHIAYKPADADGGKKLFSTITQPEGRSGNEEVFRQLVFSIRVNGQWYNVTVNKSLEGTDTMTQSIVTITLLTILLILIISFIINRLVLQKLWRPFYDTLASMRQFELGKNKQPQFISTNIEEFAFMNDTLTQATTKAGQDYQHLKEFTENASHELQTPLAIIRSKLDLLIQDEHLSETQSTTVQGAYEAIERLAKLNQGLLLLARIENGQYGDAEPIELAKKIKQKLLQFDEMITAKKIILNCALEDGVLVKINSELADIMLNNVFSNAIKYNIPGGSIHILLTKEKLSVSNTGQDTRLDESRLFRRFSGKGLSKEGVGLGLAIVQQAANFSGVEATYKFTDSMHEFVLTWNAAPFQ